MKYLLSLMILTYTLSAKTLEWPREYNVDGNKVTIHQPQIDEWQKYSKVIGKAAVIVKLKGTGSPIFGAMYFQVNTRLNTEKRLAALENFQILKIHFPIKNAHLKNLASSIVNKAIKQEKNIVVDIDRIADSVEQTKLLQKEVDVSYEVPPIFYSSSEAILINFLGDPKFAILKGTGLKFAANTNWDILLDPDTNTYYLLNKDQWLKTDNLIDGKWTPVSKFPAKFKKIPNNNNWSYVKKNLPGKKVNEVPRIFFSIKPAELILLEGAPKYSKIPDTGLLYVTNTKSDLFKYDNRYYFLAAGRWFSAKDLSGPWESALNKMPNEFRHIPFEHEKSYIKAAIPGTEDAKTAIITASIPREAKAKRDLTLKVTYKGEPEFVSIKNTNIEYAINSQFDVFKVYSIYYCCYKGIWFKSSSPKGTWSVTTNIPDVIYDIPASSPKHYVTYVFIKDYDEDYVTFYCTSGYYGCYISNGVIVYGSGYWHWHHSHYQHYYHYHCYPYYYSYGCGIRIDYHHGDYYRGYKYYGPYGGAGAWASYDYRDNVYRRGGYAYGPHGSIQYRERYNDDLDRYAGGYQVKTPYGSWGKGVVSDGDQWLKAGYKSDYRGKKVALKGSEGGKLIGAGNGKGNNRAIGKDKNGDIYVGRDGNIYRRGDSGWEKRGSNGNWTSLDKNKIQNRIGDSQKREQLKNKLQQVDRSKLDRQKLQQRQQQVERQKVQQRLEQQRRLQLERQRLQQLQRQRQLLDQQRRVQQNLNRVRNSRVRSNVRTRIRTSGGRIRRR